MINLTYEAVKEFISNKLRKISGSLPQDKIAEEINNTKKVIEVAGIKTFALMLSIDPFIQLEENDWVKLSRELETHFNVKMNNGLLIQGDEQQTRDTTWWTAIEKQNNSDYYWNRYNKYLAQSLPPEVVKTIDVDTDIVMNNLENPEHASFSRYGMVVGHVQSGKTGNYAGLICKAADAGYKFVVVVAGGMNNLRNQTQERLNESFIGETKGLQVGAGKGNSQKDTMPLSLTTIERDFNKTDADRASQGLNFDNISVPILIVIKKNTKSLKNVIDWLKNQYKNSIVNHAMLVIDDESDYASINTRDEENPTAINTGIRTLLSLFHKSVYVAYTATPYANIFIDHQAEIEEMGRDLFPKDFIYALDAPSNYFGARKVFIDTDNRHLIPILDHISELPMKHKSDMELENLPLQMKDAIHLFLLNICIRNLRGQGDKHNSMLIHATRFTNVHIQLGKLIDVYLKTIKTDVNSYGNLKDALNQSELIRNLKTTFDNRCEHIEFSWEKLIYTMTEIINTVVVREVHQRTSVPLEYRDDVVTNAIVIGGSSLARGYTLVGLSVSYFLRSTVFYDTLMQMARWFGYRFGYEDLCKVYMPEERIRDFADIIRATEDLFADFKLMAEHRRTPEEFGLAVKENPDSALQVTARNKQKNVTQFIYSMRLDGTLKETSYLPYQPNEAEGNLNVIKSLISKLENPISIDGSYIWHSVSKEEVKLFLESFKTYERDPLGLTSRMPIAFIKKYVENRATDWDISLHGGTGGDMTEGGISIKKQNRKLVKLDGYYSLKNRQVSSETAEAISIKNIEGFEGASKKRRDVRAIMPRPLLMLHILDAEIEGENQKKELAAFGISFPGNVLSRDETVTLKINTVYYQNLLQEIEIENQADD